MPIISRLLISDPTQVFDVEVNLNERSRGLRWFFSFYVTFSADTKGGVAQNAILLLDEPGLFLHIESQKDLQLHFEKDFYNQIIYTTHSPFMIPISNARSSQDGHDIGRHRNNCHEQPNWRRPHTRSYQGRLGIFLF